eukprot:CAMPEP_0201482178 /NCGR_PEP_ID=MMETSP0151_2-20130828/6446_1 /ASSEMBLY_ACC=CAM_ASM_000257 /TAXON_ID=200890 /ORGANISM="Paramoeba atlantica, Strain 621/1 / CCAP 1560/9" /LENGTH=589 /DNA_ID=CAMNT_0047864741 /DNA_START=75 /DNA_END=1841 /DNA_ORIENTATION=+
MAKANSEISRERSFIRTNLQQSMFTASTFSALVSGTQSSKTSTPWAAATATSTTSPTSSTPISTQLAPPTTTLSTSPDPIPIPSPATTIGQQQQHQWKSHSYSNLIHSPIHDHQQNQCTETGEFLRQPTLDLGDQPPPLNGPNFGKMTNSATFTSPREKREGESRSRIAIAAREKKDVGKAMGFLSMTADPSPTPIIVKTMTSFEEKPLMPAGWDDNVDDALLEGEALEASKRDRESIRGVMRNCPDPEIGLTMLKIDLEELLLEIDLRLDSAFCQVLGALATSVAQRLTLLFHLGDKQTYSQYSTIGLLVHFESLLSTIGAELGMLGDMNAAVGLVGKVAVQVREKKKKEESEGEVTTEEHKKNRDNEVTIVLHPYSEKDDEDETSLVVETEHKLRCGNLSSMSGGGKEVEGPLYLMTFEIPTALFESLRSVVEEKNYISIIPVLFTQGINEQQSKAIMLGQTGEQERINKDSLEKLKAYFLKYVRWVQLDKIRSIGKNLGGSTILPQQQQIQDSGTRSSEKPEKTKREIVLSLHKQMEEFSKVVETSHREKNTQILPRAADFVRMIKGLRMISCKSAKDRTSMSVTW